MIDAELIALCDRLAACEARHIAIYHTIEDDDEADAAAELITPEYEEIGVTP